MKILIIDDDLMMLRATARALRSFGWDVATSCAPIDPVGSCVVLSDWHPHGREMIRRCKLANIPIVIFTGTPDDVHVHVPIVAKPFDAQNLNDILRKARK